MTDQNIQTGQQPVAPKDNSQTIQQTAPTSPPANGDYEKAQKEIEELTVVAKQAMADLSNYRKRVEEEKKSFAQFANAGLLLELLTLVDHFDRALTTVPQDTATDEWFKGIQGIDQQLHTLLEKYQVRPIASVGQKLNPIHHEALMQGPGEKDIILEEFEKGYLLGDKVLRPAKVKVGSGL